MSAAPVLPTPSPAGTDPQPSVPEIFQPRPEELICGADDLSICGLVRGWTGSERAGEWAELLLGNPFRIAVILLVGLVLRWVLHRGISRLADKIADGVPPARRTGRFRLTAAGGLLESSPLASERRVQRARTMASVLRSVTTGVVAVVVLLMVLAELGANIAPLLASAGILGVALGFGSQTLVRDFLSGIFMIVEDQYGVGDVVDLGEATGAVEAVGLRVTRLRDVNGTVWYVRNGEILRVGNQSQGWARAVIDVGVGYGEDVTRVQDLLRRVGHELIEDPEWSALLMEEPEVWGVEALSVDSVVVRLVVKTLPLEQWKVARELRRRIKATFDAEGVEIPFPQRTVWMREGSAPRSRTPVTDRLRRTLASATGATSAAGTPAPEPQREAVRQPVPPGESDVASDVDTDVDSDVIADTEPGRPGARS